MTSPSYTFRNPLRILLFTSIFIFCLLLLIRVGLQIAVLYNTDSDRINLLNGIIEDIRILGLYVFDFVRPFLQLVIVLIIMEWLLNKFGLSLDKSLLKLEWNIQTVIALVIIAAFSLSALGGIGGVSDLKDLALVVVGFYFGTQRRVIESTQGETKVIITEEHTNDINKQGPEKPESEQKESEKPE